MATQFYSSCQTSTPITRNTLPSLPLELREQIYAHLLSSSPPSILIPHDLPVPTLLYLPPRTLPSIAFTSHHFFLEVVLTFLSRTTLCVPGPKFPSRPGSGLYRFLESLGDEDEGFGSVRKLEYRDLKQGFAVGEKLMRYATMKGRESQMGNVLVKRCMGIREVSIVIDAGKLITPHSGMQIKDEQLRMTPAGNVLVSPKYFEEGMRLSRIFEHPRKFVLKLVFKGAKELARDCGLEVGEVVGRHVELLERCRVEKGSKVSIVVEYT